MKSKGPYCMLAFCPDGTAPVWDFWLKLGLIKAEQSCVFISYLERSKWGFIFQSWSDCNIVYCKHNITWLTSTAGLAQSKEGCMLAPAGARGDITGLSHWKTLHTIGISIKCSKRENSTIASSHTEQDHSCVYGKGKCSYLIHFEKIGNNIINSTKWQAYFVES